MILFSQFPRNNITSKNISFSFFQYSDRTAASTETNDTSTESSDTKLFADGKSKAWHYQEGSTPTCCKNTLEKKVNLKMLSQDAKFFFLIVPILFLFYELSLCPLILNYNKVYLSASLIAKPMIGEKFL
jgi:hypothetical protein